MTKKNNDISDAIWTIVFGLDRCPIGSYTEVNVKMADDCNIKVKGKLVSDDLAGQPYVVFTAKQWVYYKGMYECIAEAETKAEALGDIFSYKSDVESITNEIVNSLCLANNERIARLQKANEEMLAKYGPDSHK